jgi:AcrR family transcriptional regulator
MTERLTREQTQQLTRKHLLAAARREIIRQGFSAASVRDIAKAAGYTQGAFYSNFSSKDAILLELLREHMQQEIEQLGTILQASYATPDSTFSKLESWAASLNSDVDWSMLAMELQLNANRSRSFAREFKKTQETHRAELGKIVGQFFAMLGRKPPLAPDEIAAGFIALAQGLALQQEKNSEAPAGRLIMTFARALIVSADKAN